MPEKVKPADDLLDALDSLTGLIAEREQEFNPPSLFADTSEPDLDGFDFGPARDTAPVFARAAPATEPELPSPGEIEALVDTFLDRRLADLREQLKREIMIELRRRYPGI